MSTPYNDLLGALPAQPKTWLVTGVAGFIGSNLLETLLALDQTVVGLDNFATGHRHNLDQVQALLTPAQWTRFRFIEGDIRNLDACRAACAGVDDVLHRTALGSVPRFPHLDGFQPRYRDVRAGDVRHSLADIGKAPRLLGYAPGHRIRDGLIEAMAWYARDPE